MEDVRKIEVFNQGPNHYIAIQYLTSKTEIEKQMRNAFALFDTPMEGMSEDLKKSIEEGPWCGLYRTAVLEYKR